MNYLKQFKEHIANSDYAKFLSLWEEYCLGDEIDSKEMKLLLSAVKRSDFAENFGRHATEILPLWEQMPDGEAKHIIFKDVIDLQTTNSPELAETVLIYLKHRFGEEAHFQEKLRLVGLRDGQDFQGAVSGFELLSHLAPGKFVFHTGGWGVGEIIEVSFLREQLSVEFDYVPGTKDLSFINACKTLIPLRADHFLSQRFGSPDALEALAKKDPVQVIHMLLRDLGPKTAAEIKEEMYELIIPEEEWARWWQATRTKVKKDTLIETPDDLHGSFALREEELSHEDRLAQALSDKPDANTLIHMVHTFVRDFPSALKSSDFKGALIAKLREALSFEELTDSQELQIHFFLSDLIEEPDYPAVQELIKRLSSLDQVMRGIEIMNFKKRLLMEVRSVRDDWVNIFLGMLLSATQNPVRDYILQELLEGKQLEPLTKKLDELLATTGDHPNTFLWYFQKVMKKDSLPLGDQSGKNRLFEALLILLNTLEQSGSHRDLIKKIHAFITNNKFAHVRKIIQHASKETVHEFLLLATKCHSFEDHDIKILHSLAEVVHPSLAKLSKKYDRRDEEEEVLWTTEEGYNKVTARMERIATVETVENAKEIEIARGHGDLRENAEFKSALERRDRLQSELKQLSDMAKNARILTRADVKTDCVGVGSVVECKDKNGKMTKFTLLGPWDADPENNIISFQSKLAQTLAGSKVGDHVTIQQTEYTIADIRNYFGE